LTTEPRTTLPTEPGSSRRSSGVAILHRALGHVDPERRAADEDDAQVGQVVIFDLVLADVEDPLEHHRDDDHRRGLVALEAVERLLGVKAPADDQRRTEPDPHHRLHETERVERRHAHLGHLARVERDLAE
jgi:hypothetical protein